MTVINLSNNKLIVIEKDVFKYNKKLKHIDLSKNFITNFNLNLKYTEYLTNLILYNNKIKTLQENVFKSYLNNTNKLDIRHNLFSCNSSMNWIKLMENIITSIDISTKDKCTLSIHKDDTVLCFIYKDLCRHMDEKHNSKGILIHNLY